MSSEERRPLLAAGDRLRRTGERPRGGGPSSPPYSPDESFRMLAPQAKMLEMDVTKLPPGNRGDDVVFEATLHPNYLANSHHPAQLLAEHEVHVVGARRAKSEYRTKTRLIDDAATKALVVAGTPEAVLRFARRVQAGPGVSGSWDDIVKLARIGLPRPEVVCPHVPRNIEADAPITWEAVLHPCRGRSGLEEYPDRLFERFCTFIRNIGGDVDADYRRELHSLTFVPVLLRASRAHSAAEFNSLRSLRPMPGIRPVLTGGRAPRDTAHPSGSSVVSVPLTTERVLVFDGGIEDTNPWFASVVRQIHLTTEPPTEYFVSHGSMVTSAILFGALTPGQTIPAPSSMVDHYRVLPPPRSPKYDRRLYWVLDRIAEVVSRERPGLVVLSLGPHESVRDDGEPDRWTAVLDDLAYRFGTNFIIAAGNNGKTKGPRSRIQIPCDVVNGTGVGACASRSILDPPKRAPYSARGPGRDGQRIQPVGLAFGGLEPALPFFGLTGNGQLTGDFGTSFAAPSAARGLVQVGARLGDQCHRPTALRTFAAHFARRHPRQHRWQDVGYGRLLESYDKIWECDANACTVYYRDKLERHSTVAMYFPFPSSLPQDAMVEFEWTIGFISAVDPRDASEYTSCGIEMWFRPDYRKRKLRSPRKREEPKLVDIERHRDMIQDMTERLGYELDSAPLVADWDRRPEPEFERRLSGKWETLLRGEVSGPASDFNRPRLDINYLFRADGQLAQEEVPDLPISMVLTMRTPRGIPIYDRVVAQYTMLLPIVNQLQV